MTEQMLCGRNSVLEALKMDKPLNKILLQSGKLEGSVREVVKRAKECDIPIEIVPVAKLKSLAGKLPHQGVIAFAAPMKYSKLEEVVALSKEKEHQPFLLLLDGLEDPQNIGAILRTAVAAGVDGVLLPKKGSCQITPAVNRASAGMAERIPVARIGNVMQTLEKLKKEGFWIAGADMQGELYYEQKDFSYPLVLVIGSEGKGISHLVTQHCDLLWRIPMPGEGSSLNASVAAALLIYEVLRKRG